MEVYESGELTGCAPRIVRIYQKTPMTMLRARWGLASNIRSSEAISAAASRPNIGAAIHSDLATHGTPSRLKPNATSTGPIPVDSASLTGKVTDEQPSATLDYKPWSVDDKAEDMGNQHFNKRPEPTSRDGKSQGNHRNALEGDLTEKLEEPHVSKEPLSEARGLCLPTMPRYDERIPTESSKDVCGHRYAETHISNKARVHMGDQIAEQITNTHVYNFYQESSKANEFFGSDQLTYDMYAPRRADLTQLHDHGTVCKCAACTACALDYTNRFDDYHLQEVGSDVYREAFPQSQLYYDTPNAAPFVTSLEHDVDLPDRIENLPQISWSSVSVR